MTKMVATVVALQQMEQGNLDLTAPVAEYCPEFADIRVLDGWDGDTPRLRAPATQATVKPEVGAGPAAEHRGHPGHAPRLQRGLGRAGQQHFWVDRASGICASIYSNFLPLMPPAAVRLYQEFEVALYASL